MKTLEEFKTELKMCGYFGNPFREQDAEKVYIWFMQQQPIGAKCIVNTGGNESSGEVVTPKVNVHGHYWKEQDSYCIRFDNGTRQYIPAKYIKFV